MTNEIKEILNNIKDNIEDNKKHGCNSIILLSSIMEQLLDYITNLQEENEYLKKQNDEKTRIGVADYKYASQMEDKVIELQQRIDKANQLIEKQKKKMYKSRNKIAMYILINLENILRGDE